MKPDLRELLVRLLREGVDLVVVGQVAGVFHGSEMPTRDLDVVIRFDPANLRKVLRAVADLDPRTADPRRLPVTWPPEELATWQNLHLSTTFGKLDLLGRTPSGDIDALLAHAESLDVHGLRCRVESLDDLIHDKESAGREKDKRVLPGLKALRDRRRPPPR